MQPLDNIIHYAETNKHEIYHRRVNVESTLIPHVHIKPKDTPHIVLNYYQHTPTSGDLTLFYTSKGITQAYTHPVNEKDIIGEIISNLYDQIQYVKIITKEEDTE